MWTPLCLNTLFCEGWCQPWIAPPSDECSAPRHGWLNTPVPFFTREWHAHYHFTNDVRNNGDIHTGIFVFAYPLSRRLWIGLDVPFSGHVDRPNGLPDLSNFDDLVVTPKVMLQETELTSLSLELGIRCPTGTADMGGGISSLIPKLNLFRDLGDGWSLRTAFALDVPNGGTPPGASQVDALYNLSLGQCITPHDAAPWGDFTYYLALNGRSELDAADENTFVTLTPGVRTHLGDNIFFLAAMELPVTGPRQFGEQYLFAIVRGF